MLDLIAPFAKAVVPLLVSIILTSAGYIGITPEITFEQAVTLVVTSLLVYFVPNRTA